MDFFEAQTRAKKRTSRLILLFALAVLGTILVGYAVVVVAMLQSGAAGSQSDNDFLRSGTHPFLGRYWQPRIFFPVALTTVVIVGLASLYKWTQFRAGGSAVAESIGGRRVAPQTTDLHERRLLNVVEEMAIASGVPVPDVYLLDGEPAINAFAAGLTTSDAVVAVTRGTMEKLTRDELQGVVAHEFSHILNGDMRLNVRLTAIVFGILVIGLIGRGIVYGMMRGRTRVRGGGKGGGPLLAILGFGFAMLLIGYIGYFFGRLIQVAVSRQREFLADAAAVQFTRNPGGITGALKKIGGYALGSSMLSNQSATLGHFLFAQGLKSKFGGLWATHPPLSERIRAIEPQFDGKMFDPPQTVDVAKESFVAAGLAPAAPLPPLLAPRNRSSPAPGDPAASEVSHFDPVAVVASIGTLTPELLANAHLILESIPSQLRDAAHAPEAAPTLVFGLLLEAEPALREKQRRIVAQHARPAHAHLLAELEPALARLGPEQRLPLLQLALPALRQLPPGELPPFLETLDELVHADQKVSTFEYALQKQLTHTLALGREPGKAFVHYHSFHAVTDEISLVLSTLAHVSVKDPALAPAAFAAGTSQLKLIESRLRFLPSSAAGLEALDAALDKLAEASGPIKLRTLTAATHLVQADGRVLVAEAELLRAIAAALDVPMPPLTAA